MPNGLSEQNQAHVASPDMCPNMTIWCIGWWVRSRCVPERGGFEPETDFFFFIIITFTPFELLAPTLGLSRILLCRLTNTGIIAISEPYINEMLHYTWACMPRFLRTPTATPTLSQDGRTPLMIHSCKSSMTYGKNFKIFGGQSKLL